MIYINRRLKAIEAINYCERHHIIYQLGWSPMDQYRLAVPYSEQEQEIEAHLAKWEAAE